MKAYVRFEMRRALRNKRYLVFSVVLPVVLYELVSGQSGGSSSAVNGVAFRTYYMVSMASYGSLIAALGSGGPRVAAERASGWVRQLRVTPLSARGYVAGKLVVSISLVVPSVVLVSLAGASNGVRLSAIAWVQLLVSLVAASIPFAFLGLAIGYWLDAEAAQAGSVAVMLGISILGGLWYPLSNFPRAVQVIGESLPSYRLASLARAALNDAAPAAADVGLLLLWAALFAAIFLFLYRRDTDRARI